MNLNNYEPKWWHIVTAAVAVGVAAGYFLTPLPRAQAAPITVAPAVSLSSAVHEQVRAKAEALRTPVFPAEAPKPRTVVGPAVRDGDYTYHTTYLYNPARVCTALIAKWQLAPSVSCVLVP